MSLRPGSKSVGILTGSQCAAAATRSIGMAVSGIPTTRAPPSTNSISSVATSKILAAIFLSFIAIFSALLVSDVITIEENLLE